MEPKRVAVEPKKITGISVRTINSDEMNPETAKVPALWERFYKEDLARKIPHQVPGSPVYGVYSAYESDITGAYDLTAGVEVEAGVDTPEGLTGVIIENGDYLVFDAKGSMPQIVVYTWGRIWNYFSPENKSHKRAYTTDFEIYRNENELAIYIAVT